MGDRGVDLGALGGTRTPNLLIRSQMLYPLSYERSYCSILQFEPSRVGAGDLRPAPTAVIERLIWPTRSCRLTAYEAMAGLGLGPGLIPRGSS
jgi:hypothetical protein